VHRVVPFGREQKRAEFGAVHPVPLGLGDLGAADVLGGVGRDATVDVREPVVAAHRGQPTVDGGGRQASLFHRHPVELDVGSGRRQRCYSMVAGPLEEPAEIVPVGVEGAAAVAGQERDRRQVSLVRTRTRQLEGRDGGGGIGHGHPPSLDHHSQRHAP
jgi:hypothetical protein